MCACAVHVGDSCAQFGSVARESFIEVETKKGKSGAKAQGKGAAAKHPPHKPPVHSPVGSGHDIVVCRIAAALSRFFKPYYCIKSSPH